MPALKKSNTEVMDNTFRGALLGGMERIGISYSTLSKRAGFTSTTFYNKKNHPGTVTLTELRRMCKIIPISKEDILTMVLGEEEK